MEIQFFDYASTTPCCPEAAEEILKYSREIYGNPSSTHRQGQLAGNAIREARLFFARYFKTAPEQIIFTGSGTESDNLALSGIFLATLANHQSQPKRRILVSSTEHPAVKKTAQALGSYGAETLLIPVHADGQINKEELFKLLTPETILVSIQQVNNITGVIHGVARLAKEIKQKHPNIVFHTDAVQAFGKIPTPNSHSSVDLISISAHKIEGPKGVGALILLNPSFLKKGLQPLIWGGDQEGGFRSGTPHPGLIAGFHVAAKKTLSKMNPSQKILQTLHSHLRSKLQTLFTSKEIHFNSPESAAPHILNFSFPGTPSGPLARVLEEKGFLISTGSACHSNKEDPDPVLEAMNLPRQVQTSALRVSFSPDQNPSQIEALAGALRESFDHLQKLL